MYAGFNTKTMNSLIRTVFSADKDVSIPKQPKICLTWYSYSIVLMNLASSNMNVQTNRNGLPVLVIRTIRFLLMASFIPLHNSSQLMKNYLSSAHAPLVIVSQTLQYLPATIWTRLPNVNLSLGLKKFSKLSGVEPLLVESIESEI